MTRILNSAARTSYTEGYKSYILNRTIYYCSGISKDSKDLYMISVFKAPVAKGKICKTYYYKTEKGAQAKLQSVLKDFYSPVLALIK